MRIHRGHPAGWRVALATSILPLAAFAASTATDASEAQEADAAPAQAELVAALEVEALAVEAVPEELAEAAPAAELEAAEGPVAQAEDEPAAEDGVVLLVGRMQAYDSPWPVAGVSLTDPAVADVEVLTAELLMITGRSPGSTDLLLWNEEGTTETVPIEVRLDTERLQADLNSLFPDSTVSIGQSQGVTVLSGILGRAEQAAQLQRFMEASGLDYVDTTSIAGVQQVQVQVRVAEVSRLGLRALGVNGFSTSDNWFGGVSVGSSNGGAINPVSIGPGEGTAIDPLSVSFNEDVSLTPAVTLFAGSQNAGFQSFIQALQENQYLRVLAEPNLVALSGETASFLAGGEFPIPVVQGTTAGGGTAVTIQYKEFGVGLKFRPVVLGDGAIRLTVASEVSELSDIGAVELEGFRVPSVVTRRAETTLEMKSGQSFAMAGLISESTSAISSSVPGLGRLPILGALFRSVRYKRGESELVLMVTSSLVEPTSDQVLPPLPGSTHMEPSDWELYSRGKLEAGPPARISPNDSEWMAERGLDRLRGPGAWSVHGQAPARPTYRRRPRPDPVEERSEPAPVPLPDPVSDGGISAVAPRALPESSEATRLRRHDGTLSVKGGDALAGGVN